MLKFFPRSNSDILGHSQPIRYPKIYKVISEVAEFQALPWAFTGGSKVNHADGIYVTLGIGGGIDLPITLGLQASKIHANFPWQPPNVLNLHQKIKFEDTVAGKSWTVVNEINNLRIYSDTTQRATFLSILLLGSVTKLQGFLNISTNDISLINEPSCLRLRTVLTPEPMNFVDKVTFIVVNLTGSQQNFNLTPPIIITYL